MAEPQKPASPQQKKEAEAVNIIRMSGRDINGSLDIANAIRQIKGIGTNLATALASVIEAKLSIEKHTAIGSISEDKLAQVESVIKDPAKYGIPHYMLNRRKDPETGADLHLVGTDLTVKTRQDIDSDIKIGAWRGYRHQFGQKVRGQRTRSVGRTGEIVGVTKKKILETQKEAKAPAGAPGAQGGKPAGGAGPAAAPAGAAAAAKASAPKAAAKPEEGK